MTRYLPIALPALLLAAAVASAAGVGLDTALDKVVHSARAAAAQRTGLAGEALELVSAQAVTWPDASLGCPQPGMGYTQALVSGYRVRLRAQGKLLDFHAGANGALVLCPAARSQEPVPDSRS